MNMFIKKNKGFTLIELLVVISIIGLLSSIVLASLNTARKKAKDAAIKQGVAQLANLMALNYNDNSSYCQLQMGWHTNDKTCTDSATFSGTYAANARQICLNIFNNAADAPGWGAPGQFRIYSNTAGGCSGTTYSFMVFLNNGKWYCSGSSGRKGEYTDYGNPPNSNPGCYGNP